MMPNLAALLRRFATLLCGVFMAMGLASGGIIYTFTGTSSPVADFPSEQQTFQFASPGFVNSLMAVYPQALTSCNGCSHVSFLPKHRDHDSITFTRPNNSGTLSVIYEFGAGSLLSLGTHSTVPGWPNSGTLKVEATPGLTIANAASFGAYQIVPDEILTVFSTDALTDVALAAPGEPANMLGGLKATAKDWTGVERPARLLYVSPHQVNLILPGGLAPGLVILSVTGATGAVQTLPVTAAHVAPGVFTMNSDGQGAPAAQIVRVLPDGSQVWEEIALWNAAAQMWEARPIQMGSDKVYLILYGTGIRNRTVYDTATLLVRESPGDIAVDYAGAQPQYPGLDQVNVLLPERLKGAGTVNLSLKVGGEYSNLFTLRFQE